MKFADSPGSLAGKQWNPRGVAERGFGHPRAVKHLRIVRFTCDGNQQWFLWAVGPIASERVFVAVGDRFGRPVFA